MTAPSLEMLTDEDLDGLDEWASPIATMAHGDVAAWGRAAWQAIVDEQRRRTDGGAVTPWPAFDILSNEECVLVGQLIAGIHSAGSAYLKAWVEETGDALVDHLMSRIENE